MSGFHNGLTVTLMALDDLRVIGDAAKTMVAAMTNPRIEVFLSENHGKST